MLLDPKPLPRLGRLAGDMPTVMRCCGQGRSLLIVVDLIRSRACRRARPGGRHMPTRTPSEPRREHLSFQIASYQIRSLTILSDREPDRPDKLDYLDA